MKIGCCAYSFRRYLTSGEMNYEQFIDLAADIGLDGVELTSYYFPTTDMSYLHSLKRYCLLKGVTVAGTAVGNRFSVPDARKRSEHVQMVKEWVDHSVELGAPAVRVFSGKLDEGVDPEDAYKWTVQEFEKCVPVAESRGVVLALENHGQHYTETAAGHLRIFNAVGSDWLQLLLDTGGYIVDQPYDEVTKTVPYAVTSQVKTTVETPTGPEPVDMERMLSTLHRAGYRGFLNIEYEEHEDPMVAVPRMVEEMRRIVRDLT